MRDLSRSAALFVRDCSHGVFARRTRARLIRAAFQFRVENGIRGVSIPEIGNCTRFEVRDMYTGRKDQMGINSVIHERI